MVISSPFLFSFVLIFALISSPSLVLCYIKFVCDLFSKNQILFIIFSAFSERLSVV